MAKAWENAQYREWERIRNLEFTMYNVQYQPMSGKKMFKTIKKPRDLYPLPTDTPTRATKPVEPSKKEQAAALESIKSTMQYKEWLKKG